MTEEQSRAVCQHVENYLDGPKGIGFDIGNKTHFEQLVSDVSKHSQKFAPEDLEIRVFVAMCLLGPGFGCVPPADMRADLLGKILQYVPDPEEQRARVMEFAIVYGAVERWQKVDTDPSWKPPWQGAIRALIRTIEPAVGQVNQWLGKHVVGFPRKRHIPENDNFLQSTRQVWSDAAALAWTLVQPEERLKLSEEQMLCLRCESTPEENSETIFSLQDKHSDSETTLAAIPPGAKIVLRICDGVSLLTLPKEEVYPLSKDMLVVASARDDDALIRIPLREEDKNEKRRDLTRQLSIGKSARLQGPTTLARFACVCGTTECINLHRLESWNPDARVGKKTRDERGQIILDTAGKAVTELVPLTLWSFVSSAVKGLNAELLKTGVVVQGRYFAWLTDSRSYQGTDVRLRLASVEYKSCATEDCGVEYEGPACPKCKVGFDPQRIHKRTYKSIILVDADPPVYERELRCACTQCDNLFELSYPVVAQHATCNGCGKSLFEREALPKIWQGTETLLQRARSLDRARRKLTSCSHCENQVTPVCWCPLCSRNDTKSSCLPKRATSVWVRTFAVAESLEEAQLRERIAAAAEEQDENETKDPLRSKTESEEDDDNGTHDDD
ncbi:MAG: hypothetical protein AB7G75_22705 [Candidatus Binatia bacterium]